MEFQKIIFFQLCLFVRHLFPNSDPAPSCFSSYDSPEFSGLCELAAASPLAFQSFCFLTPTQSWGQKANGTVTLHLESPRVLRASESVGGGEKQDLVGAVIAGNLDSWTKLSC